MLPLIADAAAAGVAAALGRRILLKNDGGEGGRSVVSGASEPSVRHTRTVPSLDALAMRAPSGENLTLEMGPV